MTPTELYLATWEEVPTREIEGTETLMWTNKPGDPLRRTLALVETTEGDLFVVIRDGAENIVQMFRVLRN